MAHHFVLLWLNSFGLRVAGEGWWFEHSMSWLQVCLSAEGAKNVSWPWLSLLRGWGSLTMTSTGKFVYIHINLNLPPTQINLEAATVSHLITFNLKETIDQNTASKFKSLKQPYHKNL